MIKAPTSEESPGALFSNQRPCVASCQRIDPVEVGQRGCNNVRQRPESASFNRGTSLDN